MLRSALRLCLLLLSGALLTGLFLPDACAQSGPTLSVRFGIAGRYKSGGWCLATVTVKNPGPDTLSGQLQILTSGDSQQSGRRFGRDSAPAVTFACPVSVPGGSLTPHSYPLYLRGIDPGQSNFTVRLVEGRERGDGRALAQIDNQNPGEAAAFTGGPIGPGDRLLIGFGGDPSAFTFLNGRQLTPPQAGPGGLNTGNPGTLQVAEAVTAADLPDKTAGYGGADAVLLRSDAPVEGLTEAQISALKGWVIGGGHLIVCGGSDPTRFSAAFFEGLLPATVGGTGAGGSLILTPKPLPGIHVEPSGSGQSRQIISGPYGAGQVTLTAYDPALTAQQTPGALGLPPVWQKLLTNSGHSSASVLTATAALEDSSNQRYYGGGGQSMLSNAVMRGPSLDAPGTSVIAIFLLVYLIVLVPVNYLVLKRLDRKEWAWGTIPALVLLFAAGTFAVGYAAKGGTVFVNRAAIVETTAGHREAGVAAALGLFSPHRTTYDLTLSGANLAAALPNPGYSYNSGGESPSSGPAQIVQTSAGASLPNTPVNMWAMRAFDVRATTDLGGTIDGTLTAPGSVLTGSLVNRTPYALSDCAVFYGGKWRQVGPLAAGATLALNAASGSGPQPSFPTLGRRSDATGGIHDRMQAALGGYFQSLSQNSQPNYYGGETLQSYTPAPGEAILAGWSRDPALAGPKPSVDGRPVTENDVSLVIVHIPVE